MRSRPMLMSGSTSTAVGSMSFVMIRMLTPYRFSAKA